MEIAGYSYTWGPITGPRDIDHRQVIRWFREQGIRSIELYDPWIQDSDASEVQCIIDALGEHDMQPCVCDVECHVVSRDADQRKAGTERFHQRLAVMHQMGVPIALILPFIPAWETDFRAEECHEWLNVALEQSLPVARELGITVMIANLGFRGDIYGQADWVVETCEHCLSALAALGIDNVLIRLDGSELPGGDGSAGTTGTDDAGLLAAEERVQLEV